ncbi:hypothetical protein [Streptomyces netropsis]|uniref:Uncharacterized protein n=1 Tax=Streptomyces netropsis TaxID=55404 RepID=A0A7W7LGB7_STRNE|nr:hypothetical protein [Streptomyces netropsis]MBB4889123.1 hypothetical protein [Streptomyces netropsis]GGR07839.1 hypothetical protein GCM10010219_09980 [Streptomyces netropsis]
MLPLLLVVCLALIGFGFLHPLLWVAAAVLIFGAVRYGRDDGGRVGSRYDRDYQEYRDRRDRQERWDRRYRRQRRGRWDRQDRQDHREDRGLR